MVYDKIVTAYISILGSVNKRLNRIMVNPQNVFLNSIFWFLFAFKLETWNKPKPRIGILAMS